MPWDIDRIFVEGWKKRLATMQEYVSLQDKETGKTVPVNIPQQEWLGFCLGDIISEMDEALENTK